MYINEIKMLKDKQNEYYARIFRDRKAYEENPTKENYANLAYSNGLYSAVDLILTEMGENDYA